MPSRELRRIPALRRWKPSAPHRPVRRALSVLVALAVTAGLLLVAPVEERGEQRLALLREHGGELQVVRLDRVRFVPLR